MSLFTGRPNGRGGVASGRGPTGGAPTPASSRSTAAASHSSSSSSVSSFVAAAAPGQQLVERLTDVPQDSLDRAKHILSLMKATSAESPPPDANGAYLLCFQLLKLARLEAEIPRLVVFGQQSMGKTTLLDYIMGGPIGYSSTDTGTRQPVVILLRPSESGRVECRVGGEDICIKGLQQRMRDIMSSQGETISSKELEVEIAIPNGVHAVFVDLPGIKDDSKAGAELTRSVVRSYVQSNPNDLYILVKKASDDPANWPWSLREFILSPGPKGLGLTPAQTVVVGTRAKEFLQNEKSDVKTQQQLLDRVRKRAVKDSHGQALPLFLLELFSLSLEEKEKGDFISRKEAMRTQMDAGRAEVLRLLTTGFEETPEKQQLFDFFDSKKFKEELNAKFQALLSDQLSMLERRLSRKRHETQKRMSDAEDQLVQQSPQSIRSYVKLYLRELLQIVTELMTGNYTIIRLPRGGAAFMDTFGGTLAENLEAGHRLCCDLFTDREQYDPSFLQTTVKRAEAHFERLRQEAESGQPPTGANGRIVTQPGQLVRYTLSKDDTNMFGLVQAVSTQETGDAAATKTDDAQGPEGKQPSRDALVTFYFRSPQALAEQTQSKSVDRQRLTVILSLQTLVNPKNMPPAGYRCWKRVFRPDGWIGLQPVEIASVSVEAANTEQSDGAGVLYKGHAVVHSLLGPDLESPTNEAAPEESVGLDELFMDAVGESDKQPTRESELSLNQRIAGEFADVRLLNQLSITHLARWLKFHISILEPDRRFTTNVLLQMMRSVRHVIDKADWEPLIADLLQSNVRGGMLHLIRLASCAASCALRRILKAAASEIRRQITCGDLSSGLKFLAENVRFVDELDQALDEYCRTKAAECGSAMRDLVFEQTHAIHFEMIEDLFDGCQQFEKDFLGSSSMREIAASVRSSMARRKQRLGIADVYARNAATGDPHDMIYEEVRIQFWVVKVLLAAPLTTKVYMHFIKDIKDKSMHLASEGRYAIMCESELEKTLQQQILSERSSASRTIPRSDGDLMEYYNLKLNTEQLVNTVMAARRTEEYVKVALEGVAKLRAQIQRQGGVDFLTRLEFSEGAGGAQGSDTLKRQASASGSTAGGSHPEETLNGRGP
ncbi:hypothetical protein Esti_003717 [Eimeria stiedai]